MTTCTVVGCQSPARCRGMCNQHYRRVLRYGSPEGNRWYPGLSPSEFIEQAKSFAGDECLPWPFARNGAGYGHYWRDGDRYAHRDVCEMRHGPAPSPDHEARHLCGMGHEGCINPNHLVWGTTKQNSMDRVTHGTDNRGDRHGMAKLTVADIYDIRAAQGVESARILAERYSVTQSNIYAIWARTTWSWLK